ncbi:Uncharacterized protein YR821_0896 [Yersinia ruckeri]|uniref:Uncharacterized protein n=1 Tax=Yersinia ruckeri TaxID=29486 RepID=A0A0A8VFL6_YERRU|nr:Uncharacterized protein YR821_0896 [Yersinia ruckeri]CEK26724.1 hypothetical protein CSF007_4780 [Yersinia ruckeri]
MVYLVLSTHRPFSRQPAWLFASRKLTDIFCMRVFIYRYSYHLIVLKIPAVKK